MLPPAVDIGAAHGSYSHPAERRKQNVCPFFPQTARRNTSGMTGAKYKFVIRNTNASKVNNNPPPETFHLLLLLQDSLSKFVGRTLKDCGEDLLVEISEILFNELAFFRLMQDLDNSNSISSASKHKSKRTNELPSKEKQSLKVRFSLWCDSLFVFCVVISHESE